MAGAGELYTKSLARNLRFQAAWPPGIRVELGDIGTVDEGVFMPLTSLGQFGVRLEETKEGEADMVFDYATDRSVELSVKAKGEISDLVPNVPVDDVGLAVTFTSAHAVVFRARGGRHRRFADEVKLTEEIRSLIRAGKWDRDWRVVTDVINAESTAALVSGSGGAGVELSVGGGVAAAGLDLLTADADVKVVSQRNMQVAIVATGGLTPLFRTKRVKRKWFVGDDELRAAFSPEFERLDAGDDEDDLLVDDIDHPVYGADEGE